MSVEQVDSSQSLFIPKKMHDECAVFGIYDRNLTGSDAAKLTFYGLLAQQHRGQEAAGIATTNGTELLVHKNTGLVTQIFNNEILDDLEGFAAIGHDRYSTSLGSRPELAHPVYSLGRNYRSIHIPRSNWAFVHNGNLIDKKPVADFLDEKQIYYGDTNDSGMMGRALGYFCERGYPLEEAMRAVYKYFVGAFSAIALSNDTMVGVRDPNGFRPFSLGELNGGPVLTSETCAFDAVGANFICDIDPGQMAIIKDNKVQLEELAPADPALCVSEFFYVARPDSIINGKLVYSVRERLGMQLARESNTKADIVFEVPATSTPMAHGFAGESGIEYREGFVINRYIGRTFIQPTQKQRDDGVMLKLNAMESVIKGKRVIVVDDSIVRGTTTPKVVRMLRAAGAREVHMKIGSEPFKHPIKTGIDTEDFADLIAANMSIDEIRDYIRADSLQYISHQGFIDAVGIPECQLDTSYATGVYRIQPRELASVS